MAPGDEVRARPGWLLEEMAHAGRENLDAGHVARYDEKEDAAGAEEVALLESLGLDSRSTVVDLGAGTGQFAIGVSGSCRRVVAVDVSPVMLQTLEANAAAAGVVNLEIVRAGFLTYEHEGTPADFVYSRYALHHLPDFWKAVALVRIRQMLHPTGILRLWDVVYGFAPDEVEDGVEAWCVTGGREGTGGWTRAELEEHVRDEKLDLHLAPRTDDPTMRVRDAPETPTRTTGSLRGTSSGRPQPRSLGGVPPPIAVTFRAGDIGPWSIERLEPVVGDGLPAARRLEVVEGRAGGEDPGPVWVLRGFTSNERYVERAERVLLTGAQEGLGRPGATCAALIPVRKSAAWWDLPQDERRAILEQRSHHIAVGLAYLPAVARRLHHSRDLGEQFDFLTWFEFAPSSSDAFEELVARLRDTDEWSYVEREVDIRLTR